MHMSLQGLSHVDFVENSPAVCLLPQLLQRSSFFNSSPSCKGFVARMGRTLLANGLRLLG